MDGPGYGEEEEPLHTILGKVITKGSDVPAEGASFQ